jgi:two-component system, OmpR family, sensor histidine kinase VicK
MKIPFLSIRYKLLLAVLLILLVSYSILLFTTLKTIDGFLDREIIKNLETCLNLARNQFYSRAKQTGFTLTQAAMAPPMQERMVRNDRVWLHKALLRFQANLSFIDVLEVIDPEKRVITRFGSDQSGDVLQLQNIVDRAFRERKQVFAAELVGRDFLSREGKQDILGSGSKDREAMMITIVIPVISESGRLLGGLVAGDIVNKDPYYPYQVQNIFGREVELTITQHGQMIASSLKNSGDFVGTLSPEILASLEKNSSYRGEASIGEKVYKTAFEPIRDSSGALVGSLSVALSREDLRRIRSDNEFNIMVSALVGILLSFLIAYAATLKVTRPLKALAFASKKIEEGDLTQRVELTTGDELGVLADYFNRMANALAERDGTIRKKNRDLQDVNLLLEKNVADRTAELRMEMERLETVLTSMAEGIVVTDRNNMVILFNPAAQRLFNLLPHRVNNQHIDTVCSLVGSSGIARALDALRSGEGGGSVKEEDLEVNGKKLKITISPLQDDENVYAGVVMSIRDVTLEEVVDRMKTEFIATVSHELKTPLTSMKGSLQFILGKGKWLTEMERELLSVCLRNTDRLIRLISDILDIAKIEEGRIEFRYKPQSLRAIVTYAIEEINPLTMESAITIINEIDEDTPPVFGDHDRLVQVLTNLLSNAVKFSPAGMLVTVSARLEGNYVAVSVADQGSQIEVADQNRLFRKFQRLESRENGDRGGTGLGLVICKEIVEKHHGRIYYQAGAKGGNIFTFTIPVFEDLHEPG